MKKQVFGAIAAMSASLYASNAISHGIGENVEIGCTATLKNDGAAKPTVSITPKISFSDKLIKEHNVFDSSDGEHWLPVNAVMTTTSGEEVPTIFNYLYKVANGAVVNHYITYGELFYPVSYGTEETAKQAEQTFGAYPKISCSFKAG